LLAGGVPVAIYPPARPAQPERVAQGVEAMRLLEERRFFGKLVIVPDR